MHNFHHSGGVFINTAITIRDMMPGEESMLYTLAKQSFTPMEALGASKPKKAVIAMVGDAIAGAMFLKEFKAQSGRHTGYLDLGFVVKAQRGKGVGKALYPAAIKRLRDDGCDVVCAMVKDDNVASWGLLQKHGLRQLGFIEFIRVFGLSHGLLLWLKTIFCIACGMNFWADYPASEKKSLPEMGVFVGLNTALTACFLCLRAISGRSWSWVTLGAALFFLCFLIGAGWLGTLISKRKWRFRMTQGGLLIAIPLMLMGTFYPVLGRWYPVHYENTSAQRQSLGMQAIFEWVAILSLCLMCIMIFPTQLFWQKVGAYASVALLFRIIAFYPFEYFGGRRVYDWNKPLFALTAIISLLVVAIA